jgi:hypothetical protein
VISLPLNRIACDLERNLPDSPLRLPFEDLRIRPITLMKIRTSRYATHFGRPSGSSRTTNANDGARSLAISVRRRALSTFSRERHASGVRGLLTSVLE